ncbi:hypothetical protein CAPTEDRAFT_207069 [Capitella teleta]|uniref:Glycosyltransferase family 92 protein n=1 Tax=Capitella teleta TaxID=283909 RepID=R7VL87_CAPTE|nr:hypothetical protein CAPTEDRAFT_207069 [Capitella teleta]|eukprot:ELU17405.1 hypothetical protein CAPTEDRAFT_207069 [Capitella teleta]
MFHRRKGPVLILVVAAISLLLLFYVMFTVMRRAPVDEAQIMRKNLESQTDCSFDWDPLLPKRDVWQPAGENQDTYVFSAHLDARDPEFTVVRIIGINSKYKLWYKKSDYCVLWFKDINEASGMRSVSVLADSNLIPETHDRKYGVVLYSCPVLVSAEVPLFVSLVRKTCQDQPLNALPLSPPSVQPVATFSVCVAPFLFQYDRLRSMIAFVESSLILGADHFFFYNHSMSSVLGPFIDILEQAGIATVINWQDLPVAVKQDPEGRAHGEFDGAPELHYFGQVAAINDCLYRNIHYSQYVVSQDLDELIVPGDADSWYTLLKQLPPLAAAYIMRNVIFPLDQENTGPFAHDSLAKELPVLVKTKRQDHVFPYGDRSKYIVNTKLVKTLGIHTIYDTCGETTGEHTVSPSVAMTHHYKNPAKDYDLVNYDRALQFGDTILSHYKKRLQQLKL